MRILTTMSVNLNIEAVEKAVKAAGKAALTSVTIDIAHDAVEGSPVRTGNNRRSIQYEVGPGKQIAREELQAAIYSTSGYGGYLETGTVKMAARPYMKPALDRHFHKLPKEIQAELN